MIAAGRAKSLITNSPAGWILLSGAAAGAAFFAYYFTRGLSVTHYDAKAHLVVARRLVDCVEPGYTQMGSHWLPLVHLIYLPLILMDSQYRSGFLPSLVSVCAFAVSGWLVFRISVRASGSNAAGVVAAVLLLANPNLEYLQSCPMTEPIYMALLLLALDSLQTWREEEGPSLPWATAVWSALGAMCRYEGWYFIGGLVLLLASDLWSRNMTPRKAIRGGLLCCGSFVVAAGAHFGYIYARLGDSFLNRVIEGNPAPYETYKRPFLSVLYHVGELAQVAAIIPLLIGLIGVAFCATQRHKLRRWAPLFLLWLPSLINISALYWGLIYRVRYSVLLLPALAVFGSLLISSAQATKRVLILCGVVAIVLPWLSWYFPREWRYHAFYPGPGLFLLPAAALGLLLVAIAGESYRWPLLVLCVLGMQAPVLAFDYHAMLSETLEHQFIESERHEILNYLRLNYDGSRIMIDMGKQAPLVYDSGLYVKEYIYNEGGLLHWQKALVAPQAEAGWLCAERGDEVWRLLEVDPHWADMYSLAVKTENLRLYRLKPERRGLSPSARQIE